MAESPDKPLGPPNGKNDKADTVQAAGAPPEGTYRLDLAIDPRKTRVIVLTWPDHSITWEAAAWLYNIFPPENVLALCGTDLTAARNLSVREIALKAPPEITDFVLMDRDMRPGPAAMPLLAADADVVGCEYPVPHMETWADPAAIHMGLVRVKRHIFERIAPPWFAFGHAADGCGLAHCECAYFQQKVKQAGFTIVRAGWCGHDPKHPTRG